MAKRLWSCKKQPFPLYLQAKTSNNCFLILIGRKNLSLLFHSSVIRVVTVMGNFFEIVTFSWLGQIIASYRNVGYIASIYNMSRVNTNQIFHYTCCITPKPVLSWRGPSLCYYAQATQLLSNKCCSGGKPLATLCSIWPARDLNLTPPAPETNALPLDQLVGTTVNTNLKNKFNVKCYTFSWQQAHSSFTYIWLLMHNNVMYYYAQSRFTSQFMNDQYVFAEVLLAL